MHKNLMGKMIKSHNVELETRSYIFDRNGVAVDVVTRGGKQHSHNTALDGRLDENA